MAKVPSPEVAEIIRRKKHAYGRFVDTKQFSRMTEIALPEAKLVFLQINGQPMTVGKKQNVFNSLAAYSKNIGNALASAHSTHVFGFGELDQVSPDEVHAIFSMTDTYKMNGAMGLIYQVGGGHYHEIWKRKGDDWFLADLRLERTTEIASVLFTVVSSILTFAAWFGLDLGP